MLNDTNTDLLQFENLHSARLECSSCVIKSKYLIQLRGLAVAFAVLVGVEVLEVAVLVVVDALGRLLP